MAGRKLTKIKSEGKVWGVCAGLADYFNIDVTIIRLIFVITAVLGWGSPVLIYIILGIVLPDYDPDAVDYEDVYEDETQTKAKDPRYDDDDRYER